MGRAIAHLEGSVPGFSDPTALALLPDEARARVESFRAGPAPKGFRARVAHRFLETRAQMMAVRTVAIDEAVRGAAAPQVVILGAGLDGRAWRMPELGQSVVFEVDHPDTQREKMARAAALVPLAREVRFVPVDFTRDRLDDRLAAASHDPTRPTTWVWEGVVMYLTRAEVEATLEVVARRSVPGSRLVIAYAAPGLLLPLAHLFLKRVGEPFRSVYTATAMTTMLAAHRFAVVRDHDVPTIARPLSDRAWKVTRRLKHIRIVVADRKLP
jgi:methyltransferase (TIGR00027 family)